MKMFMLYAYKISSIRNLAIHWLFISDGLEKSKSTGRASTCMSKWKAVQHSIVDHVLHVYKYSFYRFFFSVPGFKNQNFKWQTMVMK